MFEQKVKVSIVVSGADTRLTLETPEAYTLDVVTQDQVTKVNVSSLSVFGARHGLETLSQLIAFDEDEGAFRVSVRGGGGTSSWTSFCSLTSLWRLGECMISKCAL